ncbi:MAG: hypothetical protein QXE05_10830 [Nitrososphaeria archaeon]
MENERVYDNEDLKLLFLEVDHLIEITGKIAHIIGELNKKNEELNKKIEELEKKIQ